jgi:hypothetical protein
MVEAPLLNNPSGGCVESVFTEATHLCLEALGREPRAAFLVFVDTTGP